MDGQKDKETWSVVRRLDQTPEMYIVSYSLDDYQRYLLPLLGELGSGYSVENVDDAALLARLSACADDTLDGVWVVEISHAWHATTGFAHAHN